jgi:hypothetical protein
MNATFTQFGLNEKNSPDKWAYALLISDQSDVRTPLRFDSRRKVPKVGRVKFYLLLPGPTVHAAHWIQKLPGPGTGRPNRHRRLCIIFCYTLVTLANVHGNNRADQKVNFGFQNALNLAYAHLQFSRSNTPGPLKREGRGEQCGVG